MDKLNSLSHFFGDQIDKLNKLHINSQVAFQEINENGPGYEPSSKEARKKAILVAYASTPRPMRDYDVLQALFPGATDMNLVRPRITEMVTAKKPELVECGKATSHSGNRPVRLTQLITHQLTLF